MDSITGLLERRRAGLIALAIIFLALYLGLAQLRFPIRGDEEHFWPTTLLFSQSLRESLHALRTYEELNTPLPFFVWGFLEQEFHQGIWLGRLSNFIAAFTTSLLVVTASPANPRRAILATIGMLLCPYFLFVSTHLYSDALAILFVVAGVALHLRARYSLACLFFVLAIATRQYAVAFPVAILAYEIVMRNSVARAPVAAMAGPAVATFSMTAWYLFFDGFGPPAAIKLQGIATASAAVVIPGNALYFLSCVGLYYALVRWALMGEKPGIGISRRAVALAIAPVAAAYLIFPPLRNYNFPVSTMGLFDRALHALQLPDVARVAVFMVFGILAVLSVLGRPMFMILLLTNGLVLSKAHIAWDKYTLPLLAVFWFLEAKTGALTAVDQFSPRSRES